MYMQYDLRLIDSITSLGLSFLINEMRIQIEPAS